MDPIRDDLWRRYAEPHRRYHDRRHLEEVLGAVDVLAAEARSLEVVRWGAWFHDAVYDVGADDNEERSAQLAERLLPARLADQVARLVRVTATHRPAAADRDGAVLCDADLSVLGADADRYAEYAADVRAEYAAVPDEQYALGRAQILESLLAGPLFHTATGRERWEERARRNVTAEVRRLRARA